MPLMKASLAIARIWRQWLRPDLAAGSRDPLPESERGTTDGGSSAQPGNADGRSEILSRALVSLAVDSWRFSRVFHRVVSRLDAGEQARYLSQSRWFVKKVEESLSEAGLHVVDVEGQPFDPGIAATPINIEEFAPDDFLVVDQMIEPIIMSKSGLVRSGTVTLKKVAR